MLISHLILQFSMLRQDRYADGIERFRAQMEGRYLNAENESHSSASTPSLDISARALNSSDLLRSLKKCISSAHEQFASASVVPTGLAAKKGSVAKRIPFGKVDVNRIAQRTPLTVAKNNAKVRPLLMWSGSKRRVRCHDRVVFCTISAFC